MNVAAVVLAGGASTRFGRDKLAAPLDGRPLLHHAITAAASSAAGPVVVVLAPDAPAGDLPHGVIVARDPVAHQGPLAGLAAGLAALPATADAAIVVGGDMPTLVPAVLRALAAALEGPGRPAAARLESDPLAPLPFALRTSTGPVVAAGVASGRRALRAVFDLVETAVVPAATWRSLDPDGRTLHDVDAPDDLDSA